MWLFISAWAGVRGEKRVRVSASEGGLTKPLMVSAAGAADMAKPVVRKARKRVVVRR